MQAMQPAKDASIIVRVPFPFLIIGYVISWIGIVVLDFRLNNREDVPNKPDKRGNKGSFAIEFKTARPKQPDKMKSVNAKSLD